MNDLIIIPQSSKSIIANIENDTIKEIEKIDIPFNSNSIITKNNLVVSLCYEIDSSSEMGNRFSKEALINTSLLSIFCKTYKLKIHNLKGDLIFEKKNANYKAINFIDNIVYLGGEYKKGLGSKSYNKGEMFSVINLDEFEFKTNQIELPIKIIEGKSIDDILINKEELILVDNIVYPKYLIKYNISSPQNPIHLETLELPNNGTYEHIIKGDINDDWMILYSSTVGMGGSSEHITVSENTQGHLHLPDSLSFPPFADMKDKKDNTYHFRDIVLIKNKLFILRSDGLGFIDLNKTTSDKKFKFIKTELLNISRIIKSRLDKLIAINESGYELINNEPLTKYKNNGRVTDSLKANANNNLWSKFKKLWS